MSYKEDLQKLKEVRAEFEAKKKELSMIEAKLNGKLEEFMKSHLKITSQETFSLVDVIDRMDRVI